MNLCQKCYNAIDIYGTYEPDVTVVPASECEFWAHKELNNIRATLKVMKLDALAR